MFIYTYIVSKVFSKINLLEVVEIVMVRIASHLFGLGALLFFTSRVIAFVFAAHELVASR